MHSVFERKIYFTHLNKVNPGFRLGNKADKTEQKIIYENNTQNDIAQ